MSLLKEGKFLKCYILGRLEDRWQSSSQSGEAEVVPPLLHHGCVLRVLHQDHRLPSQDHSSFPGKDTWFKCFKELSFNQLLQYEWLDPMCKELSTLVFFVMTGYKFRPASNNPYFAVASEDDMEEVLVGSNSLLEQATVRKSYKLEDYEEDEDETVVLFSKEANESSHDLD